jgi:predicted amidohydrolase YtcJ
LGYPVSGFQKENSLSRYEALMGMTLWAAHANFEEKEKGSIEIGKFADFVILDRDIMKVDEKDIPSTKVVATILDGQIVYSNRF